MPTGSGLSGPVAVMAPQQASATDALAGATQWSDRVSIAPASQAGKQGYKRVDRAVRRASQYPWRPSKRGVTLVEELDKYSPKICALRWPCLVNRPTQYSTGSALRTITEAVARHRRMPFSRHAWRGFRPLSGGQTESCPRTAASARPCCPRTTPVRCRRGMQSGPRKSTKLTASTKTVYAVNLYGIHRQLAR